jgi:8-oxo-dGTP pyrophosphatase MutT (NUDIX family)
MAGLPHGGEWGGMTELASRPAVAVAIVTSRLGVLVGRRRDGNPPWTFPGGKIEPGESPADAAVRETLKETGLRVRATGVIGQRVHPQTGILITYVVAELPDELDVTAAGNGELTEVQWVIPEEADGLMGKIFVSVREYLRAAVNPPGKIPGPDES